jgi:Tfp pilus assembly protein PilX
MTGLLQRARANAASEDGLTLLIAIAAMLVTSLLLVAAFTAARGDIRISHRDAVQKQAYYAALAGVQQYEYKLQANPNFWQSCEKLKSTVPEEPGATYQTTVLKASSAPTTVTGCETTNPFGSVIESKGANANTFRIKSVGSVEQVERTLIATFTVTGFLDYVFYTNFETEDPALYEAPSGCSEAYYSSWHPRGLRCSAIQFVSGDSVNGPMHTNDATNVTGAASFGREGHNPADVVEIGGGTYPNSECRSMTAKFFTATKVNGVNCYVKGATITPPESDTSLAFYVEPGNEFAGVTHLVLNGSTNKIAVSYFKEPSAGVYTEVKEELPWPTNGLIYVHSNEERGSCEYSYAPNKSDSLAETEEEQRCGNVYVSGTYSKSLTVAAENDLIIDGSTYPTSVAGSLGSAPTGTVTLGLIASNNVRVYHPVAETYARSGTRCSEHTYTDDLGGRHTIKDKEPSSGKCEYTNETLRFGSAELNACDAPNTTADLSSPWIYGAILSTSHSFAVDNFSCGEELGKLHVYGGIAQNYRGIVGTSGGAVFGQTGYIKDYKYDDRLATDEPPYFLAPLKAGWKISRETAPNPG